MTCRNAASILSPVPPGGFTLVKPNEFGKLRLVPYENVACKGHKAGVKLLALALNPTCSSRGAFVPPTSGALSLVSNSLQFLDCHIVAVTLSKVANGAAECVYR